jgi:hypothetical protein
LNLGGEKREGRLPKGGWREGSIGKREGGNARGGGLGEGG